MGKEQALVDALRHHLTQAHKFIESTEAFGQSAISGILQAGNDKSTAWNINESKAALLAFSDGLPDETQEAKSTDKPLESPSPVEEPAELRYYDSKGNEIPHLRKPAGSKG